ncbi:MAG: hypothetical protein ABI769_16010 [Pseudomonadota bacterium]
MKHLVMLALVGLVAFGGAASAQSPTMRARTTTTTVTPAQAATPLPTTAPTTPAIRRVPPSDTVREITPIPRVTPARDRITDRPAPMLAVAPSIAAVWQPLNDQVEVFAIDPKGALKDVWKHHNGFWEAAFFLSGPGLAPPGAPLTAVWQPLNEQLEVFTIAMNGALTVTHKAHNGAWVAPSYITPPNFARPGAHVTAVFQPLNNQLEVFAIDATGAVKLAWKAQNGRWQGPVVLTPPGIAPPGAPLTAVWQPLNEQLEVFWVDTSGALRGVWKQHNGRWAPPFNLTAPGFAYPHANVAAIWQPLNEQLEVFAVNGAGAINVVWKAHNGRWNAPYVLGGPEIAKSGTDIMALWNPQDEILEVVTVGTKGNLIHAWKFHNGAWKPGPGAYSATLTQTMISGSWPLGAALAGVVTPVPPSGRREIFTLDDNQVVHTLVELTYESSVPSSITTANFGPIYGAHAAHCSHVFRIWSHGLDGLDDPLQACIDFMGITAYCAAKNANVTVGYPPQSESNRFLQCTARSGSNNVVDQFVHIWTGIGQGLGEAAVATIVYSPEIIQGYACLDGVVFACASLAVDLGARAVELPPAIQDAVDLANDASACVNGDVVSCAKLGAAGARAVGIPIPGEDAGQVALLTQQCLSEDYAACLRLGEKAAMAAGVPMGQIKRAALNAQNCYEGGVDACIALGRQAAKAGIPVGGVVDGAENLSQCSAGSLTDCQQLGQAIAAIPR